MKNSFLRDTLSDKVFLKNLMTLGIPIALQNLLLALVGASDTIMLGSLDQNSMAAVSLATQIQFVQNLTVSGIIAAFHVLGAQYRGKEDKRSVDMLFSMTLRISALVSLLTFLFCLIFPYEAMGIFTDSTALRSIGERYLRIASFSYLLTGLSQSLLAMLKLYKDTRTVAYISLLSVVLNIVLNALLIYGLFGLPSLGVEGAAAATLTARVIEMVLAVFAVFHKRERRPDIKKLFAFDRALSRDDVRQLIPLLGAYLVWTIGISAYASFLGHMGEDAAAANSLSQVVRNLALCFTRGLAGGASIIIGYELGSGNLERARVYGFRLSVLSLLCGVFTSLLVLLSIPLAPLTVSLTAEAIKDFQEISLILAIYVIGASFNSVVINGMFASGGDTLFDCYSIIVMMWLLAIPLAYLGTFHLSWPVWAVYSCTCLDEVGKIPWTIIHYRKMKWLKDLTR